MGYKEIQQTRPSTIGASLYGEHPNLCDIEAKAKRSRWRKKNASTDLWLLLSHTPSDNPVGILAYIGDKFHEWSDVSTFRESRYEQRANLKFPFFVSLLLSPAHGSQPSLSHHSQPHHHSSCSLPYHQLHPHQFIVRFSPFFLSSSFVASTRLIPIPIPLPLPLSSYPGPTTTAPETDMLPQFPTTSKLPSATHQIPGTSITSRGGGSTKLSTTSFSTSFTHLEVTPPLRMRRRTSWRM